MILIIAGTNRKDSNTLKVANTYKALAEKNGIQVQLLSLTELTSIARDEHFSKIEAELLIPAKKFLFISPEYNGSISGVLKLMIDLSDVKQVLHGKKAALTGVATGRAGNLRGLDHLTNILNHTKITVLPNKLPLSSVSQLIDNTNLIVEPNTVALMETLLLELNQF
jgi:chromate reductase, NAD(P)H dehydrogenase (quinone)